MNLEMWTLLSSELEYIQTITLQQMQQEQPTKLKFQYMFLLLSGSVGKESSAQNPGATLSNLWNRLKQFPDTSKSLLKSWFGHTCVADII